MRTGSGARKVLYGSNYPMIMPQAALAELDALGLDERGARAVPRRQRPARVRARLSGRGARRQRR